MSRNVFAVAVWLSAAVLPSVSRAWSSVSAQGIIERGRADSAVVSPGGGLTLLPVMSVGEVKEGGVVRVRTSEGCVLSLEADAIFPTDAGRIVSIRTFGASSVPGIVSIHDLEGREIASWEAWAIGSPVVSSDGLFLRYRERDGVTVVDLRTLTRERHRAFDLFAVAAGGTVAGAFLEKACPVRHNGQPDEERWFLAVSGTPGGAAKTIEGRPLRLAAWDVESSVLVLTRSAVVSYGLDGSEPRVVLEATNGTRFRDLVVVDEGVLVGTRRRSGDEAVGRLLLVHTDGSAEVAAERQGRRRKEDGRVWRRNGEPWPIDSKGPHPIYAAYGQFQH